MDAIFTVLCLISASYAYYIEDGDVKASYRSKEGNKNWVQLLKSSGEYEWLGELTPLPPPRKEASKELYNWIDEDVVEKTRYYHEEADEDEDGLLELAGGCELTAEQYKRLKDFRRDAGYVNKCYCQEGGVYCKLKTTGEHLKIT